MWLFDRWQWKTSQPPRRGKIPGPRAIPLALCRCFAIFTALPRAAGDEGLEKSEPFRKLLALINVGV
jgi:hypothetical protein